MSSSSTRDEPGRFRFWTAVGVAKLIDLFLMDCTSRALLWLSIGVAKAAGRSGMRYGCLYPSVRVSRNATRSSSCWSVRPRLQQFVLMLLPVSEGGQHETFSPGDPVWHLGRVSRV